MGKEKKITSIGWQVDRVFRFIYDERLGKKVDSPSDSHGQ